MSKSILNLGVLKRNSHIGTKLFNYLHLVAFIILSLLCFVKGISVGLAGGCAVCVCVCACARLF